MKVGDRVTRLPQTISELDDKCRATRRTMKGVVVYIHPLGRYHIVEFETAGGPIRESFSGVDD